MIRLIKQALTNLYMYHTDTTSKYFLLNLLELSRASWLFRQIASTVIGQAKVALPFLFISVWQRHLRTVNS